MLSVRTCTKVVALSQTTKACVFPASVMSKQECGKGNFVGGDVCCIGGSCSAAARTPALLFCSSVL